MLYCGRICMKTVTFDFDDTIVMSHMLIEENKPVFVFDGFNEKIIGIMRSHIMNGDDVHIVTARSRAKEDLFPDFTVPVFLMELSLEHYFTPERIHYTEGALKLEKLQELGSTLHYDDSLEEIQNNFGKIPVKNPFDYLKDSSKVGKAIIYDKHDRILILRRTDEGKKWDIPGGHLKKLEISRPDGPIEGTEREIMEETGLLLPYLEEIGSELFYWKGKSNDIMFFQTKLEQNEPKVNLNMQDFQENDQYKWVSIDEMFKYAKNGTQILRSAVEMVKNQGLISEESRFQRSQKRKHRKAKKKLIGLGKNKHFGGGKGHKRPKMSRSKSAPVGFGALEEENGKKKRKIKVKIIQNVDEKRKKRRKKGQKTRKNRGKYAYYGGYLPHKSDHYSSDGGDGGGGE
jgi:8-oxo-dGTP pyrophosphatase MutT (NUDIX family)